MYILNQMLGNESDMWFLNEIIGGVCIAAIAPHKYTTNDTQNIILAESLLIGSFRYAMSATTKYTINR